MPQCIASHSVFKILACRIPKPCPLLLFYFLMRLQSISCFLHTIASPVLNLRILLSHYLKIVLFFINYNPYRKSNFRYLPINYFRSLCSFPKSGPKAFSEYHFQLTQESTRKFLTVRKRHYNKAQIHLYFKMILTGFLIEST